MTPQPSRKSEQAGHSPPGGCPRCGTRIPGDYKYCPNCAYRLRPDIGPHEAPAPQRPSLGQRLFALGGYLAFASLLLLVALTGIRLFTEAEVFQGTVTQTGVARDPNVLALTRASFRRVEAGTAIWGVYDARTQELEGGDLVSVDDPFDLCVHEITNDQYYRFLLARAERSAPGAARRVLPEGWTRRTGSPDVRTIYEAGEGNLPVTGIDYWAALEFCAWFWEEELGSDPDIVADLPTPDEFVLAARARADSNFPWEDDPGAEAVCNFSGELLPVDADDSGRYRGFYALVGNAAEWVHGPWAAGWSCADGGRFRLWETSGDRPAVERETPFCERGFDSLRGGLSRGDVGFRIVLRRAPALPSFVPVAAGPVQVGAPIQEVLPPFRAAYPDVDRPSETGSPREDHVRISESVRAVEHPFEIARTEITNRQYLAFLVDYAATGSRAEVAGLLPESFETPHPFWHDPADAAVAVFFGRLGAADRIDYVHEPGRDNQPVQWVTAEQADAYADWLGRHLGDGARRCRLPRVAEFLRAGRAGDTRPYPWGDDPLSPELVCAGRADEEGRAVSLLGRLGSNAPDIVGLAGNLAELVREDRTGRLLLAGGFYLLPAEGCTLDCFFDASWSSVQWDEAATSDETGSESRALRSPPYNLAYFTGFRVVRVKVGF